MNPVRLTRQEIESLKSWDSPVKVKDWAQSRAIQEWRLNHCRGTFEAATGTGKTRVGVLACAREFETNPDAVVYVCVPTETLRDNDWPAEFRKWGHEDLLPRIKFLCHASMNTVREELGEIDLLIFDEVHNITELTAMLFEQNKVFKVLGLTATIPSTEYAADSLKRELISRYCPSVFKITLEEAVELKLVSDFEVFVMKFDLDDKDFYVDGGTVKKPYKTTEKKHYYYLTKSLQRAMFKNPNAKFYWIQKRMAFLYGLRQKELLAREIMGEILKEKDGSEKRTLIFCGGIEQSHKLCGDWVYHSKVSDQYLRAFQAQEIPYLGVVQALNEGKNIEELDQILVIQLNSKELDIIQRIGRTIRFREGHVARVIILVAKGTVDEEWYKSAFTNFDKRRIKEFYVRTTTTPAGAAG